MKTETVQLYYECKRCNLTTLNKGERWLPCPRGSCEAEPKGQIVTTTKLILKR